MGAVKPIFREVRQAAVKGAGDLKDRFRGLTDNLNTHTGNVSGRTNAMDNIDGTPNSSNAPNTPNTADGGGSGSSTNREDLRGVDRGDGRDVFGHFVGSESRPWVDKEGIGLDQVENDLGVTVVRDQVNASIPGHNRPGSDVEQVRRFDGLFDNGNGTWTGIEVKSGSATRNEAQQLFDDAISPDNPAFANLPSGPIRIVQVILQEVP